MHDETEATTVNILDKPFTVKCPKGRGAVLSACADHLNAKMQEVRDTQSPNLSLNKIAITAALNIVHDLFNQEKEHAEEIDSVNRRIKRLQVKIQDVLEQKEQLEL